MQRWKIQHSKIRRPEETPHMKKISVIFLAYIFFCSGCASTSVYKEVFNEEPAYNQKVFPVSQEELYQATLRAICSKNFLIEKESTEKDFILARRAFQKGKRTIALVLQAKIISDAAATSTLYLSALETTERSYVADRTRFLLFIVPLPGGGGKEATSVKEGEKIIEDKTFYQKFFNEIEHGLNPAESGAAPETLQPNANEPVATDNEPQPSDEGNPGSAPPQSEKIL